MPFEVNPGAVVKLVEDTGKEFEDLVSAIFQILALKLNPLPIADREKDIELLLGTLPGLIRSLVTNLSDIIEHRAPELWTKYKPEINKWAHLILDKPIEWQSELPKLAFNGVIQFVTEGKHITPETAEDFAFSMMGAAFIVGQATHLLAALAGYLGYPMSSIWAHNAQLFISLFGYEEITKAIHGHFYQDVMGVRVQQGYLSKYRPNIPSWGLAGQMLARRKITDAAADELYGFGGVDSHWLAQLKRIAYRPIRPQILAAGFAEQEIDRTLLDKALADTGLDPEFIGLTRESILNRAIQPVRQAYVTAARQAAGKGQFTLEQLNEVLDECTWSDEAKALARKTYLVERQMAIAAEAEKEAIEQLSSGILNEGQARALMHAAGIDDWKINTTVAFAVT